MKEKQKKLLLSILNINMVVGTILIVSSVILLVVLLVPQVVYTIFPGQVENETTSIQYPVVDDSKLPSDDGANTPEDRLPPIDESLSTRAKLSIDTVGIRAHIQTDPDPNVALADGPWLVPNLGDPINDYLPTIIASHRWGTLAWTKEERELKSFYNLPDVKAGDQIEIQWQQRVFEYEVYKVEESTQINDYNADLILYTCKVLWQSPVRVFVYAERSN